MNRSWRMPIVGMTLLVAVVLAASTAAGQVVQLNLQVVERDAKGALQAADAVGVELWLGAKKLTQGRTDASGMYSVPVSKADSPHEIRLSKAGYTAVALPMTYHLDGGYFSLGPVAGVVMKEKIAPGVRYMIMLLPAGGAVPAAQTSLNVHVYEAAAAGKPRSDLGGARVAVSQSGRLVAAGFSNNKGIFISPLPQGTYLVTASKAGYQTTSQTLRLTGAWGSVDVYLRKDPGAVVPKLAELTVEVRMPPKLAPVAGAIVHTRPVGGSWSAGYMTQAGGKVVLTLKLGKVEVRVKKDKFATATATVIVPAGGTSQLIILQPSAP